MNDQTNLPANRFQTLPATSPQTWNEKLRPASVTETTAHLSTCLALVKPVGMSGEDTQAWLRTAARELAHLPPDLLAEAAQTARRTCTHHAQIVPTIIRETDERMASRRKLATPVEHREALPAPDKWIPNAAEIEAIKRNVAERLKA